jgi:cytochrome c oxidase cbb3-type subunit III
VRVVPLADGRPRQHLQKISGAESSPPDLYPTGQGPAAPAARATFTLTSGQTVVAPAVAEDDFSVTVVDPLGARQTYQRSAVKVKVEDPLAAHFEQLGRYTDADMHNVYAYLETLK